MSKKVSKRQQRYIANKEAKCGTEINCAVCGKAFIKKQYAQAFCCSKCKDTYWNAKGDRHLDSDYYRRYNHRQPNAKDRVGYAMLNSVVRIGTYANENHIIDDVTERVNQIFEERREKRQSQS